MQIWENFAMFFWQQVFYTLLEKKQKYFGYASNALFQEA
jgi:hypothetical protein